MLKEFSKDLVSNLIRRLILSIIFLYSIKLYTKVLHPVSYGNYSILLFIVTLISLLSTSWLTAALLRLSKENNKLPFEVLFTRILKIQLFTLIIGTILLLLFFLFLSHFGIILIGKALAFTSVLYYLSMSIFNFFSTYYIINRKIKKIGVLNIVQALISILLSYVILNFYENIVAIFISGVVSYLIVNIYIYIKDLSFYPRNDSNTEWKSLYRDILKYSIPLLLMNLLSFLLISSDQFLMKLFKLGGEIGVYAANYSVIDKTITVITSLFTATYTPLLFASWAENGREDTYKFYKKVIGLYLIVISVFSIVFYSCYEFLFHWIMTDDYLNKNILLFILIGSIFFNLTNIVSEVFTLQKKTNYLAYCFILPTFISISLNLYLLPNYGIMSAAYVTAFSYFILFVITISVIKIKFLNKSKFL